MRPRALTAVLIVAPWAVFVAAMVWPTTALIHRCIVEIQSPGDGFTIVLTEDAGASIEEGQPPGDGFTFSSRQLGLLWRSLWMAGVATGVSLIVSIPGAYVVGRLRRLSRHPLIAALFMALLLCPPMVYSFGWERILPSTFDPYVRCIGVWALWGWPIPAMLIGVGWSRVGIRAYEAALVVASPTAAFLYAVIPALRRYVAFSALIVFVLYFNDYGVPHACGLLVYPTELLGWAAGSGRTIDTVWPAAMSVVATSLALLTMFAAWRRCAVDDDTDTLAPAPKGTSVGLTGIAFGWFILSWLLPVLALVVNLASPAVILEAFETYFGDLVWSLVMAILSGLLAVGMGLSLVAVRSLRVVGLVWTIAFGALPGALIGEALVSGYNHATLWWIYDHWPIVALSYVSRFGWIGVLTAVVVSENATPDVISQARVDGATRASILSRIQIPMNWPVLLCGAAVVMAMSVAEVATSSLVRVPAFSPIAHVLIEKFHRFEDGMLISLSLWLVAATIPPALLLMVALGRRRRP